MELAEKDEDVMHILLNSSTEYDDMYRMNYPSQIMDYGMDEKNALVSVTDMAEKGKMPFIITDGAFLTGRAGDYIRSNICEKNLNIKLVGLGSGLSGICMGPSHISINDITVLSSMKNLTILSPATPSQVAGAVEDAYAIEGPVYIRMETNGEKEYFEPVSIREGYNLIKHGDSGAIITTGSILEEAIEASMELTATGKDLTVLNITSISPLNADKIWAVIHNKKHVFIVEEHSTVGGLGDMISDLVAEKNAPIRVHKLGIEEPFTANYHTHYELRRANGLDRNSLADRIYEALTR